MLKDLKYILNINRMDNEWVDKLIEFVWIGMRCEKSNKIEIVKQGMNTIKDKIEILLIVINDQVDFKYETINE